MHSCVIKAAFLQATEVCIIRAGLLSKPDIKKLDEDEPEVYVFTFPLLQKNHTILLNQKVFSSWPTQQNGANGSYHLSG